MHPTRKSSCSSSLLWICCLSIVIPHTTSKMMNAELSLLTNIFENYNPTARPLKNSSESIFVQVSYFLSSIDNVDEKGAFITLSGWLHLEWTDEFLTWIPDDFGGLDSLVVPADKIWTPDLVFESGVKEKFFNTKLFWVRVSSNGRIAWEPGGTIDLSCNYNLTYYPCDSQTCRIKLVTWTNTGNRVYSYGDVIDISNFGENGEWSLSHVRMNNVSFSQDGEIYSEVHSFITIKRKPLFQVLNILLPVTLLSVLNLLVFCIPVESGEKVSLSVTVLLAFSVWLLMMNGMMPTSSDYVPIMGMYLSAFLVSSSVSVFISVMVLRVYEWPKSRPVPIWVATPLLKVSDCYQRLHCRETKTKIRPESPVAKITPLPNLDAAPPVEEDIVIESVNGSKTHLTEKKKTKERRVTWHQVADAIDTVAFIFFLLFFCILTFTTVIILLREFQPDK